MPTTRTPINRSRHGRITPAAIEAFKRMEAARTCDGWWEAHAVLHAALGCKPWEYPAFEYPDAENPYPDGSHGAKHWQQRRNQRPEAFDLFRTLQEAT